MGAAHVVLADADARSRDVLAWLLREHGHRVTTIGTPDDLPRVMADDDPDLVILGFEGHDARRALSQIAADERAPELPVLAAVDGAFEAGAAPLTMGATDVIARPIRVPQFLARVDAQLRLRTALREARRRSAALERELARVREDAAATHEMVEIVHEIVGEGSTSAIYRVLARRLARALGIHRCSVVLANPGDSRATVAVARDDPALQDLAIRLGDYPEIADALETGRPVLVEDAALDPRLQAVVGRRTEAGQLRSVIVLPFTLDRWRAGVLFLRTRRGERALTREDVDFADPVLRAAVAAVRRSHVLESARADNQRLEELATTDSLTRLLNRRAMHDRLAAEVQRAHRYGAVVTLLLIDVDHFKAVNDTYGHPVGDSVLAQMASLLRSCLRTVDVAARYGGEEFVAILPETTMGGAVVIAERLRERIARHEFTGTHDATLRLTVSVGVASYPAADVRTTDELIARADAALYRAKAEGRNQVRT